MEYLRTVFVIILLRCCVIIPVWCAPQYYNSVQETCVLSLVIPKESIRNNCNNEGLLAKLQSLEAQLRQLTHHVRIVDTQRIQPALTQYASLADKFENMESQLSALTLKNRYLESKYLDLTSNVETLSRSVSQTPEGSDRLLDPIKPLLMAEFQNLKTNLMQSLEEELYHLYSQNVEENGSVEETGSAIDMDELAVSPETSSLQKIERDNSSTETEVEMGDDLIAVESVKINQLARSLQKLTSVPEKDTETSGERDIVSEKESKEKLNSLTTNVPSGNQTVSMVTTDISNSSYVLDMEQDLSTVSRSENGSQANISENVSPQNTSGNASQNISVNTPQNRLSVAEKDSLKKEISLQLKVIIQRTIDKALQQQMDKVSNKVPITDTNSCNLTSVTAKLSELEANFADLQQNVAAIYQGQGNTFTSADFVNSQKQIAALKSALESLGRRVDGPQNTLQQTSQIQDEMNAIRTNIQINLKERLESEMMALRQRVQVQEGKNNMSSSYLNIFKQTLQSYRNESQHTISDLQQDINSLHTHIKHLNKSRNHDTDIRLNDIELEFGDLDFRQNAFEARLDRIKDGMAQQDRDIGTQFRAVEKDIQRVQSRYAIITNLSRTVQIMDIKQTSMARNVVKNELTMKYLYIQQKLESGDWMQYNFSYNSVKNSCNKLQYVRQNNICSGSIGKFVGVILCSEDRYKIFLGNSLEDEFLDIADEHGHGQDHCQFVGGESESLAIVEKEFSFFPTTKAYIRAEWGEEPRQGSISPILTPVTSWYECGVKIP